MNSYTEEQVNEIVNTELSKVKSEAFDIQAAQTKNIKGLEQALAQTRQNLALLVRASGVSGGQVPIEEIAEKIHKAVEASNSKPAKPTRRRSTSSSKKTTDK